MKGIELEDDLGKLIKEFGDDLNSLELLFFFSRHPNARFDRTAVLRALKARHFDTGAALQRLINKKIVVSYNENGVTLYALTREEPVHGLISQLANIDQGQWQVILEGILDAQGIP